MNGEVEFLRRALPMADRIALGDEELARVADHARAVRATVSWGKEIPEDVFLAFVLFPRVNNERLVFYQDRLWKALWPRIADKTMAEAALEVNLWCCEHASYQSTDDRTADALTVLRRTFGRCGEESTLLTSALRAVGIPARQMYVPRWSHCDDNHAWVEVWIHGIWHYMGACEPEPVLDSGWFTSAASKAMLVHTRAYGIAPQRERVENRVGSAFIVNRTAAYAKTRLLTVRVMEHGRPKPDTIVRFELANLGEFYPISEQTTNERGEATLLTGLGTLHLHVHDRRRRVELDVDVSETGSVILDFDQAAEFDPEPRFYLQRPPLETRIQPAQFTKEVAEVHARRLAVCDRLRAERRCAMACEDPDLAKALGNREEIEAFLKDGRFKEADKRALLSTLTDKDYADVDHAVLTDALASALPFRGAYPDPIWREAVLCPRVADEPLKPHRALMQAIPAAKGDALSRGRTLWRVLQDRVTLCDPELAVFAPGDVWQASRGSAAALDVLFVAAARAQGMAARLNPETSEKELYVDGTYQPLLPGRRADARLVLTETSGRELLYGTHFTMGIWEDGAYRTLNLAGKVLRGRLELSVPPGTYRILTCARQIDGAVDVAAYPAVAESGETAEVAVTLCPDRTAQSLLGIRLPILATRDGDLPRTGHPSILAVLAPGQEPTEHFLNELLEARDELKSRGIHMDLVIEKMSMADNAKLQRVLAEVADAQLSVEPEAQTLLQWREQLRAGDLRLPLAVALDDAGKGLFAFTNYNVGSVLSLIRVIDAAKT